MGAVKVILLMPFVEFSENKRQIPAEARWEMLSLMAAVPANLNIINYWSGMESIKILVYDLNILLKR